MLNIDEEQKKNMLCDLFARIYRDFVGDVGCWCIYFLNYVILQPGESLFLGPNVPHAYIYGGNYNGREKETLFFIEK